MAKYTKEGNIVVDDEALGDKLFEKGKSNISSINIFKGKERYTKGIEYLERAVDQYTRVDAWAKAAEASLYLAKSYEKHIANDEDDDGSRHKLSKYYEQAADCAECIDHKQAVKLYGNAAYLKQSDNNFSGAAAIYKKLAQIEEERGDIPRVIEAYDLAAENYSTAGSMVNSAGCTIAKATFSAEKGDYKEAAMYFYDLVKKNYMPYENCALCFKSLLCMFVYGALQDDTELVISHDRALLEVCNTWRSSFEHKAISKMITGFEAGPGGIRTFTKACSDYDMVANLNTWTVKLLLKIKSILLGEYAESDSDDDVSNEEVDYTKMRNEDGSRLDEMDIEIKKKQAALANTSSELIAELLK